MNILNRLRSWISNPSVPAPRAKPNVNLEISYRWLQRLEETTQALNDFTQEYANNFWHDRDTGVTTNFRPLRQPKDPNMIVPYTYERDTDLYVDAKGRKFVSREALVQAHADDLDTEARRTKHAPTDKIDAILAERGARYGDFTDHARVAQAIQRAMHTAGWEALPDIHKQALTVIADKIARILTGDCNYADNLADIQGYARLVEERLPK